MKNLITRLFRNDEGQDLIEYALIAGLIALGSAVAVGAIGTGLEGLYNNISTSVANITF